MSVIAAHTAPDFQWLLYLLDCSIHCFPTCCSPPSGSVCEITNIQSAASAGPWGIEVSIAVSVIFIRAWPSRTWSW